MTPNDLGGYTGETVKYDFINQKVITGSECNVESPLRHRPRKRGRQGEKQRDRVRDKKIDKESEEKKIRIQGCDESLARQSILQELDRESSHSSSQGQIDTLKYDIEMKKKSTPADRARGGLFLSNTVVPIDDSCRERGDKIGLNQMIDPSAALSKRKSPSKPALNVTSISYTDFFERGDEERGGQEFKLDSEVNLKIKSEGKCGSKSGSNGKGGKYLLPVSGPRDLRGRGNRREGGSGTHLGVPTSLKKFSPQPHGMWGFWGLFRWNRAKKRERDRDRDRDRDRVGLLNDIDESSSSHSDGDIESDIDSDSDSDSNYKASSGSEMEPSKHRLYTSDLRHLSTQRNDNGNLSALETMANSPVSTGEKKPNWTGSRTEGAVQRRWHSPEKKYISEVEVEVESSEEKSTMQGLQRRRRRDRGRGKGVERERKSRYRPSSECQVSQGPEAEDEEYRAQIDKKVNSAFLKWGGASTIADTSIEEEKEVEGECEVEGGGSYASLSLPDMTEYSMSLTAHNHNSKENPHAIFAT
jgi:hypothetical protein